MTKNELTFKQKIKLYEDLITHFRSCESVKQLSNNEMKSLVVRLEKWGRELKIRQHYYDV